MSTVVPYKHKDASKREQIAGMFDTISPKYDLLNHLLSGGRDVYWRKRSIRELKGYMDAAPKKLLDVATGTGDFAFEALMLKPEKIIGVDFSERMLALGGEKIKKRGIGQIIEMRPGDSEGLPFDDDEFDAVIVSFSVRNFEHVLKGLTDMHRVTRPNGACVNSRVSGWSRLSADFRAGRLYANQMETAHVRGGFRRNEACLIDQQ